LPGWKESTGVGLEIDYAKKTRKPIVYALPVYSIVGNETVMTGLDISPSPPMDI
jgi:hypothetical protein